MDYDVFVCHVHEDKEVFVNSLAHALKEKGLKVWYDDFTVTVGDRLLDVINDILDFSKIEARKLNITPIPFKFRDMLHNALKLLAVTAHQKGLEFVFQVENDVPEYVVGDPGRLRQILINLVSNAVKFSSAGKDIKVKAFTFPDRHMRIAIEDEGCGIPSDKIKAVQQPFGQVSDPRYYRGQGTGLGLPLAKAMVELHGGRLTVESKEKKGTKVYLDFPVDRTMASCEPSH